MPCSLLYERRLSDAGIAPVAGIDEAGRGPLAGPVVVAAAILPTNFQLPSLDDSKKLSPKARERLYTAITENPYMTWTSIAISPQEIDRLNILGRRTRECARLLKCSRHAQPMH
jgi:ribonuclease HII